LFLDEVGDLPLDLQAKLLRVLETGEVRSVGGARTHVVDVRIVSATHHDLDALVREGRFREDLYYRLNVVRIDVPPLRDRPDDVQVLVEHFLRQRGAAETAPRLGDGVMKALVAYAWPGNVRQLENEIVRASLLADDGVIELSDLSPEVRSGGRSAIAVAATNVTPFDVRHGTLKERVDRLEAWALADALAQSGGNKSQVARDLGLSRAGLNLKLKRLGLWDGDDDGS
ncbi:MAG: sigma-54-dependent Fis family transcriptional regulator, partial [Myxococcales bacterium]|nr:sigma-54-dependent Fis family transcriptional regulator [Myxococcales bacterium]